MKVYKECLSISNSFTQSFNLISYSDWVPIAGPQKSGIVQHTSRQPKIGESSSRHIGKQRCSESHK